MRVDISCCQASLNSKPLLKFYVKFKLCQNVFRWRSEPYNLRSHVSHDRSLRLIRMSSFHSRIPLLSYARIALTELIPISTNQGGMVAVTTTLVPIFHSAWQTSRSVQIIHRNIGNTKRRKRGVLHPIFSSRAPCTPLNKVGRIAPFRGVSCLRTEL